MAQPERPLSPFMNYRWQYTNTLSILHRITGLVLSLCFLVLVYWLAAAAAGPEALCPTRSSTIGSPPRADRALRRRAVVLLSPAEWHPAPVLGCGLRFRTAGRAQERLGRRDRRRRARTVVLWCVLGAATGGARMSLRSPLGRVLGLGSAKGGSGHWYSQRVTVCRARDPRALVRCFARAARRRRVARAVVTWLHSPFSAVMAVLLVVIAAYHAHLGLQVIFEDYVADKGTRLVAADRHQVRAGDVPR